MSKRWALYSFRTVLILIAVISTRCGGMNESGSGGGSSASINLVIQNPDPNASGSAKAIPISDVSQAKTLTSSDIDTCTLTVSASDISTITHAFSVASGASAVTTSLTVPAGSGRTFALDCSDSSETTNNIAVGYKGSSSADIGQGSNTISLSPQFKNLVTDDSSGVKFMRLNQENSTQTKLTIGLGSVLTDAQMIALRCVIEFDPFARRTSLGVIDANQSTGLTTGSKSGSYILITGGTGRPDAYVYDSSDSKVMKLNPSWTTQDDGNTLISITFGITQLKTHVDNNETGQYAGACSLTGTNPYDLLPNSGYAEYELDANTGETQDALGTDGAGCSTTRSGETCEKGDCPANSVCRSLTAVTSGAVVTNLAGPAQGSTVNGDTDGIGSAARFHTPIGACVTPDGTKLFVGDSTRHIIREITISTANVTTVAGASLSSGTTDGDGSDARFNSPRGCTVDPTGTYVYIADFDNHNIRRMTTTTPYTVTTIAGTGSSGSANGNGTAASFNNPWSVLIDNNGTNLYVADTSNHLIRKIVASSPFAVTTLAGSDGVPGNENGTGTAAQFNNPRFLAIDSTDTNLYVTDFGSYLIRKIVVATQVVSTLAGSGVEATIDGTGTGASFDNPQGITIDSTDTNLYVTEMNPGNVVRQVVISTTVVTTLAGSGVSGDTNGTGTAARFSFPHQISIGPTGILYIAGGANNKIRQIQ